MEHNEIDPKIIVRGKEFFQSISGEAPSIFNKGWWTGKVMDWSMKNEDFKVKLFRFVDVLPTLSSNESLVRHIEEYFASESGDLPPVMKAGLKSAGLAGKLGGKIMAKAISSNIEKMGRQFIVGQQSKEAVKNIVNLRKDGFAFTIDVLGEATLSETEAEERMQEHLELLDALKDAKDKFKPLKGSKNGLDWDSEPVVNLSIKPTGFYSQMKPRDIQGSVDALFARLAPVYRKVIELGGAMCIDMESLEYREITMELFKKLRSHDEFRNYPHLAIVFQTYLKCTDEDVRNMIAWAEGEALPMTIRLVKGAYWDFETVRAKQNGWDIPVYTIKAESDAAFERNATYILEHSNICRLACASHNVRTIAAVLETAKTLNVPDDRFEFQVLYGMAEPVRLGLQKVAKRVRLYCPYGELIPGMAYLVRRLLENTANESFLKQSFADEADVARLLENPADTAERERAALPEKPRPEGLARFDNERMVDFTVAAERGAFPAAIARIRDSFGTTYPLYINGQDITTTDTMESYNPARTNEVLGHICQAGTEEIEQAIVAAKKALPAWRDTPPAERAEYMMKAAQYMRENIFDMSALQVLEVGKQWDQAYADLGEAIDFLEYYAREMIRLGKPRRMGHAPGEMSLYQYRPKGIAAVIAPWNFPLAISCGMTAGAIVTGNCVLFKPSGLSSIVGYGLVEAFKAVGLPDGVFNYTPGRSSIMGDYLVEHKDVNMIAFTGSMEVGLRIMHKAAVPAPGQIHCKKVIAEMGGKNALIVDDDAELDEAVSNTLYSAFGFQGQKCSACSRVIVLDAVYDKFVGRLVEAARSIKLGASENPANYMGPVVDRNAQKSIMEYVELARKEGNILLERMPEDVDLDKGCYVPLTIVDGITPEHRIAQEEVFGPLLAVMRAKDFDQALDYANSTKFALTGGLFSRSPKHLERARTEFHVGNLYLNRNNTGALVERHPFGGYNMSGIGSKAGGPDYLLQFMDPYTVCENTMRRGFAPIEEDDDWI
ncbi:proline dehydrogenase family protein [Desulfovibrio ferrophilus]|uniref:L-glutamate gamma-semialdehyde dehydrogenase n=1 Tax=Desulfovibrio ferrophilus TaxID=241368 RepID=A0A2Z6AU80_9BACT|nr:proline dehydrogenase family protein [Desulfovibrio ferrophilus]BBD06779.1 aldehyde Dehydrogenase [Desulfovibrio ferrophilus]